jgi:hypothetical protein
MMALVDDRGHFVLRTGGAVMNDGAGHRRMRAPNPC